MSTKWPLGAIGYACTTRKRTASGWCWLFGMHGASLGVTRRVPARQ